MLSLSHRPRTGPGPPPPQSSAPPLEQSAADGEGILETVREDVVTLEHLIRVRRQGRECSLVRYRPTEKHKKCAGVKIDPVVQINMFLSALRDNSVPEETCLHTVLNPAKKYLWIRVSLADLAELSLEPLWTIKGRVELYSKSHRLVITIEEPTLRLYVLNPHSRLLACPSQGHRTEDILAEVEDFLAEEGARPTDCHERPGSILNQVRNSIESEPEPSSDESEEEKKGEKRAAGRETVLCTVLENKQKCPRGSRARARSEPCLGHSNLTRKTRKMTRSKLQRSLLTVRPSFRGRGKTGISSGPKNSNNNNITSFSLESVSNSKRALGNEQEESYQSSHSSADCLANGRLSPGDLLTVVSRKPERVSDSDPAHGDFTRSNPSQLTHSPHQETLKTKGTSVSELPAGDDRRTLRGCSLM